MMKLKFICWLVVVALVSALTPALSRAPGLASIALMLVTVIDGTGAPPKPDMTVIIVGYRIAEIAKSNAIEIP